MKTRKKHTNIGPWSYIYRNLKIIFTLKNLNTKREEKKTNKNLVEQGLNKYITITM